MTNQKQYETEVTFRIRLHHWETTTPERIVETAKQSLTQYPMVVGVDQIGEPVTTPEWPRKRN